MVNVYYHPRFIPDHLVIATGGEKDTHYPTLFMHELMEITPDLRKITNHHQRMAHDQKKMTHDHQGMAPDRVVTTYDQQKIIHNPKTISK